MQLAISLRILGLLLTLFSSAMLVPLVVAVMAEDETVPGFLAAFSITLAAGLLLWLTMRGAQRELRIRDGFLVTALFWTVLGLFGALPFALTETQARKAMEEKRDAVAEKKAELERIKQRDGLVQGYMNKMLTPCNSNPRSVAATSSAGAPPAALPPVLPSVSVEEVAALLAFVAPRRGEVRGEVGRV